MKVITNPLKNKHAISTAIGTILLFLILASLMSFAFWYIQQYRNYNQVIEEMIQFDRKRLSEQTSIGSVALQAGSDNIQVIVWNEGSEPAHLVALWVIDETINDHWKKDISYYVYPGGKVLVNETYKTNFNNSHIYSCKIVTERGNFAAKRMSFGGESTLVPDLIYPYPGMTDVYKDTTLYWTKVQAATKYHLQVCQDESFTNFTEYYIDENGLTDNFYNIAEEKTSDGKNWLYPDTKYYWRVRAYVGGEWQAWSYTWYFTTGTAASK